MAAVLGIKRQGKEKLVVSGTNRIWFCDGCGTAFLWDDASDRYGSERDIEDQNYHRIWIACSASCREQMPEAFPAGIRKPKREV